MLFPNRFIGKSSELKELVGKSVGQEQIFICPYCPEVRGKPDTSGKLYYNPRKGIGKCFLCDTVVVSDESPTLERVYERYYSKGYKPRRLYNISGWTTAVKDNADVLQYLLNRGFDMGSIARHYIRACSSPYLGVVIPNLILDDETTDFFQIRILNAKKQRYSSPSEAEKPIYNLYKCADSKKENLFICEGALSSIAAERVEGFDGVAVYGKYVSEEQAKTIIRIVPHKNFYILVDGGELSAMLTAATNMSYSSENVFISMLPFHVDPNEISAEGMREVLKHYTVRYTPILRSVLHARLPYGRYPKEDQMKWDAARTIIRQS